MKNTQTHFSKISRVFCQLSIATSLTMLGLASVQASSSKSGAEYQQQETIVEAKKMLEAKSFESARSILLTLTKQGNAEAFGLLGEMYWFGDGTAVDMKTAETYFKQGAAKADAKSQGFLNLIAQREARKGEISFYTNEAVDPKFRYLDNKCVTPEYGINSYAYNQKLNTIWRKCYREFQSAIQQAKEKDQVVVPEDLLQILTEDEIKKVEANNRKIADLILENMDKSKAEIEQAFVAWADTRRNELRNSIGEKMGAPIQLIEPIKTVK